MGGPGSGRNRTPVEVKRRRGTYRADRDGPPKPPPWLQSVRAEEPDDISPSEQPLPQDLGAVGLALWTALVAEGAFEPLEVPLLSVFCRHLDTHEALMQVVRRDGLMQEGRVHPAAVEAREQAAVLVGLAELLRAEPTS